MNMTYKFLYDAKVFCSIPDLPYMVVASSVSRITCDKVFLECHIRSLDRQCHGNNVTKFSWSAKECDEVFLECHIWSLDRQCHGKNVTKFS